MAHWTISVNGVREAQQLERLFGAFARLGVPVRSGRLGHGHVHLVLEPGAPTRLLQQELVRLGFDAVTEPGEHLLEALSERERELMEHLAAGLQMKEAARRMGIETNTAREYWARVKRKWGVRTFGQAVSTWMTELASGSDGHGAAG